jgi:3-hydroxyisobutyrate dehydrogenase-like beta-hydroxyacid dehydrogenase
MHKLAMIGFGEAANAFVQGWGRERNFEISAYDIKTDSKDAAIAAAKWQDFEQAGVGGCKTLKKALKNADVVFSLVTADQANAAALAARGLMENNCLFFDGNSCAPDTKKKSAAAIDGAGGRYVDMAIVAPVYPTLNKTPVLLCGDHVAGAGDAIRQMALSAKTIDGPIGKASAIKMTRSIMMKGLEALMIECVLAGRKAGVDDIVLESLEATYPGFGWKQRAAYMFERVMTHGIRRAAEMREVALTVDDLNLSGKMAHATVDWHQRIGELELETTGFEDADYGRLADILLNYDSITGRL